MCVFIWVLCMFGFLVYLVCIFTCCFDFITLIAMLAVDV